ncbi:hypothetical protein EGW08_000004, partial [Elysia chlorotica]
SLYCATQAVNTVFLTFPLFVTVAKYSFVSKQRSVDDFRKAFCINSVFQPTVDLLTTITSLDLDLDLAINMPLEFLFGRKKTPEEMLRQNQRALNKAMRDLDRERQKMEQQEKKVIADIKKMAKQGQMDAVKVMAKDLVRTRRYVKKFISLRANIQAVSLKIQTLKANNTMAQAMKGVTKAMATMNKQLKLPQIQKIMMEFEKQSEIMDMKEEMMSDAIDDALGDEEDEEESDAIVSQVLDELGLQMADDLAGLPSTGKTLSIAEGSKTPQAAAVGDADADLEARLDNLRRQ